MSTEHLRDLLDELVEDVGPPHAVRIDDAWETGRRRSRRGAVLAAAGTVAVLLLGTGIVVRATTDDAAPAPVVGTPGPSPSRSETPGRPTVPERPDARYEGVPVWWAPPAEEETDLEWFDSALPRSVDLSPGRPPVEPGERALAVFTMHDAQGGGPVRFVVLTPDGETWDLPAGHVEANRDRAGNAGALTPFNGGLSPDGRRLLFAQPSSIELYDFASGAWTTIDTPDWLAERAKWLDPETIWVPNAGSRGVIGSTYGVDGRLLNPEVPHVVPGLQVSSADQAYGIWVDAFDALAGSYFLSGPVGGGAYSNPEGIVAQLGDRRSVLALSVLGRGKACCPVVGWLDDDVVAFESRGRVLAWRVASGTLYRVSETTGFELGEEAPDATWAWQALDRG